MTFQLHEPQPPQRSAQATATPTIYVTEPIRWEYRQFVRDLEQEGLPEEGALNRLADEAWELTTAVHAARARYIFKRCYS